jgi:nucleotide-binding universal stress UspA family protein
MIVKTAVSTGATILLATDFSKPARRAVTYALKLAAVLKSRLILLHVIKAPPGFESWSPGARRSLEPLKTKALLALGRVARLAHENGVTAEHRLLVGIPVDSILKVAEGTRTDLIIMGTHGRTGWDRLQLGSTAEAVLRKAPCPALTVHASAVAGSPVNPHRVKLNRILVAMDFSASSEAALRCGAMLAERLKGEAVLVHACEPSRRSRFGQTTGAASHRADRRIQKAVSASWADQIVRDRIILPGNPVEVILDQAKSVRADLIVMGTHGRRGMSRLMLGSVAESVVRRAGCPVLTVKAGVRERPEASKGMRRGPAPR